MATTWVTETDGEVNYTRLCRLLYDGGILAVRTVFDGICPPASLRATLKTNRWKLQKLKKPAGKVLSQNQWNLLYPPSGASPKSEDFDITLLFVLLRNICYLTPPATGWNELPPSTDTSLEANLVRIKHYRNNVIAHSSKAEVDNTLFKAYWSDISDALVSLGLKQYDIDELKSSPLGAKDYNQLVAYWDLSDADTAEIKTDTSEIKTYTLEIKTDIAHLKSKLLNMEKTQVESEIANLTHIDFTSLIQRDCKFYQQSTRQWILNQVEETVQKASSEASVVLIRAGPGMGKSIVAAKICDIYQKRGFLGGCHFFQHSNSVCNNPRMMLQSIARQLCNSLTGYQAALETKLKTTLGRNISDLNCEELFGVLFEEPLSQICIDHNVVIVIDALDECASQFKKEFEDVLKRKLSDLPSWIRFVITTRPLPSCRNLSPVVQIEIDPSDQRNVKDLREFFTFELAKRNTLYSIDKLMEIANGLFLVAHFVLEILDENGHEPITEVLKLFPYGISSEYKYYFTRIQKIIKPYIHISESEDDSFFKMLEAMVATKSPIPKKMFYEILCLKNLEDVQPANRQDRNDAVHLLHTIFPVENDHVSVFHNSVIDWLNLDGENIHEFSVSASNGCEVLVQKCLDVLKAFKNAAKKGLTIPFDQPLVLSDSETFALRFGLEYIKKSPKLSQTEKDEIIKDFIILAAKEQQVDFACEKDTQVPAEIKVQGPQAELAYRKALKHGKVVVNRGRIMLVGQARAGKTSLKKSLLGLPFNPGEESTVGVEVDPSCCSIDVDNVKNWQRTTDCTQTDFADNIARLIVDDLKNVEEEEKKEDVEEKKEDVGEKKEEDVEEKKEDVEEKKEGVEEKKEDVEEKKEDVEDADKVSEPIIDKEPSDDDTDRIENNINRTPDTEEPLIDSLNDTKESIPEDVTEKVIHYLQGLSRDDSPTEPQTIVSIWDFAGQHLYYASHPVFLSPRALYLMVYNLSKDLNSEAEPCVRQGTYDILLKHADKETNLESILSWLASIHSIRPVNDQEEDQKNTDSRKIPGNVPYLRPPVIVVGTNADCPFEDAKKMEGLIKKSMSRKSFHQHLVKPFFTVNNTLSSADQGIQQLQEKINDVLQMEPYMGELIPVRWLIFEKAIKALVEEEKTYHLRLPDLVKIIEEGCFIQESDEIHLMLDYYHDLGVIIKHGGTVVLQAQWLIDLFRKLITVRPYDDQNPMFEECWNDLEESGILRMELVDHVFGELVGSGESKEDLLSMMEHYGLIARFEKGTDARYFVPAQLTSSPEELDTQPSSVGPCALYVHFIDGFVPHGLYSYIISKFIGWCSKSEDGSQHEPNLYRNVSRFIIGKASDYELILICRKRFIKVVLRSLQETKSCLYELAVRVRCFIESTLGTNSLGAISVKCNWYRSLRYQFKVLCPSCCQSSKLCSKHRVVGCSNDDCIHLLEVSPQQVLVCTKSFGKDSRPEVQNLEVWFATPKPTDPGKYFEFSKQPEPYDTLQVQSCHKEHCGKPEDRVAIKSEQGPTVGYQVKAGTSGNIKEDTCKKQCQEGQDHKIIVNKITCDQELLDFIGDVMLKVKVKNENKKEVTRELNKCFQANLDYLYALNENHHLYTADHEFIVNVCHSVGAVKVKYTGGKEFFFGTCFRIGTQFVLTNMHVVDLINKKSYCLLKNVFIDFDHGEPLLTHKTFQCDPVQYREGKFVPVVSSTELDYAVLKLLDVPLPPSLTGMFGLPNCYQHLQAGTFLTFVGHPNGDKTATNLMCPIRNPENLDENVAMLLCQRDKEWLNDKKVETYDVSTFLEGASGSPGFLLREKGLMVMHTRGVMLDESKGRTVEQGVMMSAIMSDVWCKITSGLLHYQFQDLFDIERPQWTISS